jgi:hypothetical protein
VNALRVARCSSAGSAAGSATSSASYDTTRTRPIIKGMGTHQEPGSPGEPGEPGARGVVVVRGRFGTLYKAHIRTHEHRPPDI